MKRNLKRKNNGRQVRWQRHVHEPTRTLPLEQVQN